MQIANCQLILNEFKSTVPKKNVTPAEVQFFVLSHSEVAGEIAVKNLEILDIEAAALDENGALLLDEKGKPKALRTQLQERNRLKGKYINKHDDVKRVTLESIWPGANARLPEKFSEVVDKEGKPVFKSDGSLIATPTAKTGDAVVIGGVTYTKADIEKLLASKVQAIEVKPDDDTESAPNPPTPVKPVVASTPKK